MAYPRDTAEFEQDCLRELARDLRVTAKGRLEVIDMWLEGSFPDTAVVVRYRDLRDGHESSYGGRIWRMREAVDVDTPEEVAIHIGIQLMENY